MASLSNSADIKQLSFEGVDFFAAACDSIGLIAGLQSLLQQLIEEAQVSPITSYDDCQRVMQQIDNYVKSILQPNARPDADLDLFKVMDRDILPLVRLYTTAGGTLPMPVVLHAWWCPKRASGILDNRGTTSKFWVAFLDAVMKQYEPNSGVPPMPIPFAWDVVFLCLDAPKLSGRLFQVVVAFTDFFICMLQKLKIFTFAETYVAHGSEPRHVLTGLPPSSLKNLLACRHIASWSYLTNPDISATKVVAMNIALHIEAWAPGTLGANWLVLSKLHDAVIDKFDSRRAGKLLSAALPFNDRALDLFSTLLSIQNTPFQDRVQLAEATLSELCPPHRELLLREKEKIFEEKCDLEEQVEELKLQVEELRVQVPPPVRTQHQKICSCNVEVGEEFDDIVICAMSTCVGAVTYHKACVDIAVSDPTPLWWICPPCKAAAAGAGYTLTAEPTQPDVSM